MFKKRDIFILLIPIVIIVLLTPVLPARIPIHRGLGGEQYIDRKYAYLLGLLPFIIYKLKYDR